jgi:hypothetical protein
MADTRPGEDKPFRSDSENEAHPRLGVPIRVGKPTVHPHVVPLAGASEPATQDEFVVSFLVSWQPGPQPPAHWVELLRAAPFGSGLVHARDLHWDGKHLSIELVDESAAEAFAVEMPGWVDYANAEYTREEHTPALDALAAARKRAVELQERLHR